MAISTPSIEYAKMAKKWELPEALIGGTQSMRDGEHLWLPQEPNESDEAYLVRLNRTFLFNVYKRTIDSLVGIAFSNNVTVEGIPKELEYLEWNINGEGQSLTELGSKLFHDALHYGKAHVYPDFPIVDGIENMTYIRFKELGVKPYIARVSPTSVIGWKHTYLNGFADLEHVRILDSYYEEDELFEQVVVNQVRYITKDRIQVWESRGALVGQQVTKTGIVLPATTSSQGNSGWELVEDRPNDQGQVHLLCAYANKQSPFVAYPVLEDLAWLNLCHYQSSSDQRNILHVARVPFLLATGFTEDDMDNVTLAANRMVLSESENANIKYVEHTGQSIQAGQTDLDKLEQQMSKVGAEVLFSKSISRQTLGGRKIDQLEALSVTQVALRSVEQMLEQAYLVCGKWLNLPEFSPNINIGADLELPDDPNPIQSLIQLQELLNMDEDTLLDEIKRRKILAAHVKKESLDIKDREESEVQTNPFNEPETNQPVVREEQNDEEPTRE